MTPPDVLKSTVATMAETRLADGHGGALSAGVAASRILAAKHYSPLLETADGTLLYHKDWGAGRPVVFVASWSLNSDMWQYQMTPMTNQGLRCIGYDRRGHGRSSQPGGGYDSDTLADDLATVMDRLDLKDATLVGHSMAAGEIVRYLSRHGEQRVSGIVLIAPTTPYALLTPDNPHGIPESFFDQARAQWMKDYPKWLVDNARPFFVPETSQVMMDWVLGLMVQTSLKAVMDCNYAMVHTDFRPDLAKVTVPALVIHGNKDASAPLELTGRRTAEMIRGGQLKVYEGAPHGLMFTHMDRLNADLVDFARS